MTKLRPNLQKISAFEAIPWFGLGVIGALLVRALHDSSLICIHGRSRMGGAFCCRSLTGNRSQRFLVAFFMQPSCLSTNTRRILGELCTIRPFCLFEMNDA